MRGWLVALGLVAALSLTLAGGRCVFRSAPPAPSPSPSPAARSEPRSVVHPRSRALPAGFLKGQLHAHSNNSGDSRTPPAAVQAWYESRGYDFLVFTDHQRITDTDDSKLMTFAGVELTRNLRTCDPPPARGDACLLHVNALFVDPARVGELLAVRSPSNERVAIYASLIEEARGLGAIPMLNHPNMQYGASSQILAELARSPHFSLLEVENQATDAQNAGDASHPSTEKLWDFLLSMGFVVYATASDDAHHYDDAERARAAGEDVFAGDLGFVVVRAARDRDSIRQAIAGGNFYASTGVILSELSLNPREVRAAVASGEARFELIGRDGTLVHSETGTRFVHPVQNLDRYLRLRVSADGAVALTQPIFATTAGPG